MEDFYARIARNDLWNIVAETSFPHVANRYLYLKFLGLKDAIYLSITCHKSSVMRSSCKCSCRLATLSVPRFSSTVPPIRANVLVSNSVYHLKLQQSSLSSTQAHICILKFAQNILDFLRKSFYRVGDGVKCIKIPFILYCWISEDKFLSNSFNSFLHF